MRDGSCRWPEISQREVTREREQHTQGRARGTGRARHRAQGVCLARRSADHRSLRFRLLHDRHGARRVRSGNHCRSRRVVRGHGRLTDRAHPQGVHPSYSAHAGPRHHGHTDLGGGQRGRSARHRAGSQVSADRTPRDVRDGAAYGLQEAMAPATTPNTAPGRTRTSSSARRSSRSKAWRTSTRSPRSRAST